MDIFFNKSQKEILEARNKIFTEVGIPALQKKGFSKSLFLGSLFGKNNLGGFTYDFCRLNNKSELERITTHINKGDNWIQVRLNIFKIQPNAKSLEESKKHDGIKFRLKPNNLTEMRLRVDDYKGPPLFYMLFLPEHKIGTYFSESGFQCEVRKLRRLMEKDMANIDSFIKRWHELHEMTVTDWDGNPIK